MKKFVAVLSAAAMLTCLAACGATADTTAASSEASSAASATAEATSAGGYKIAIVQQMDHASLDEIRTAIEAELTPRRSSRASPSNTRTSTARTTPPRSTRSAPRWSRMATMPSFPSPRWPPSA